MTLEILSDIPPLHAAERADAVALQCEGRTLTYGELHERAGQVAGLLTAAGVKPGERVAWLGRGRETFFEIFFGAARARVCVAPINTRLAIPEIAFILQDSGANLLFVTPDFFTTAQAVAAQVDRPIRLIGVGGEAEGIESYETLRDASPALDLPRPAASDDILQLYTSGTTGLPKGVRLNNANYSAFLDLRTKVEGFNYSAEDTVLIVLPLFHVAGTNISFAGLAPGGRVVIAPDFSPAEVLRLIEAERVAHVFLVPAMINMLLQSPQIATTDLSSLKTVAYGASPISEAVLAQAKAQFGCGFIQFYGMTESTGAGTFLAPEAHKGDLLRSCGKAWPQMAVRILDDEGKEAGVGEIGEIAIQGGMVMAGYWNRPEATAEAITPDGWLKTGDAGYRNAEGYVFVHDRVKDMIVSGGFNIFPREVEDVLATHDAVAQAAVVGVPDDRWGEAVKAVVVLRPGADVTADELIAMVRDRKGSHHAPKTIDFTDSIPLSPLGKPDKKALRARYWEGSERLVN
jgi:acyl-CoA synthetase (AMP-forming)/AMP-acid ligase II